MILDIKGTLVNAFIEPQFKHLSSGHLVTVRYSDIDALGRFKHHMQGGTRIDLSDKYFHFTGYTQLLDLNYHVTGSLNRLEDLFVEKDVSPAPVAYRWSGWEDHTEDEDGNLIQGDEWQGFSLPEGINDARWELPTSLVEFYVYPLFEVPADLKTITTLGGM
jgi:hypothetical protein